MIPEKKDIPITVQNVQARIWRDCCSSSLVVVPNAIPARWYECDVLRVTTAGYLWEYEIKLSRADFCADQKKTAKHEMLAEGSTDGPARFWYVCAPGVATAADVPSYAGLMVVDRGYGGAYLVLECYKFAPKLHSSKLDARRFGAIARAMCWRFWRARTVD